MTENTHALLVELYAEQAKNGASDEKLATTMARIHHNLKIAEHTTISVDLDASRRFRESLSRATETRSI